MLKVLGTRYRGAKMYVGTDRNIFSINVELTFTFFTLVHHHHRMLNRRNRANICGGGSEGR